MPCRIASSLIWALRGRSDSQLRLTLITTPVDPSFSSTVAPGATVPTVSHRPGADRGSPQLHPLAPVAAARPCTRVSPTTRPPLIGHVGEQHPDERAPGSGGRSRTPAIAGRPTRGSRRAPSRTRTNGGGGVAAGRQRPEQRAYPRRRGPGPRDQHRARPRRNAQAQHDPARDPLRRTAAGDEAARRARQLAHLGRGALRSQRAHGPQLHGDRQIGNRCRFERRHDDALGAAGACDESGSQRPKTRRRQTRRWPPTATSRSRTTSTSPTPRPIEAPRAGLGKTHQHTWASVPVRLITIKRVFSEAAGDQLDDHSASEVLYRASREAHQAAIDLEQLAAALERRAA